MSRLKLPISMLLMLALLAAGGYAYSQAQARQAATLARIAALDNCLAVSNAQRLLSATKIINGIKRAVCLSNNQSADLSVLHEAERIRNRTQALADTLRRLRQQVPITELSAKQAAYLSTQLSRYFRFVGAFSGLKQPVAKLAAASTPSYLQGSPAATLAALTYAELMLRRAEALALEQQGMRDGSNYDGFDVIGPLAIPAATTVAPGAEYRAQLLLAWQGRASTCSVQAVAEVNGTTISAMTGQSLPVSFSIPAPSANQPDTLPAQWQGLVRLQGYPADTVLKVTIPYLISKRASL